MSLASNNKKLAKNTLLLYIRTLLVLVISFLTSRIVLNNLGVENYGIHNIVGGLVSFFSIVSGTLVATTQRFITFELGKKENGNPNKVFCTTLCIHFILAGILLILFETIGLWFLNNKLNVSVERLGAANWVFQFSVLAFLISIISSPYSAVIIAHEKLSTFAYISLIEAFLKLGIAYFLSVTSFDKLIVYSFLLLSVSILIRSIYSIYCKRLFGETKYHFIFDKKMFKDIFGFAGMNFLGAFASILSNQGVDVIINLFFGVTLNAAKGISSQILTAVSKFVSDFMTALTPQITKEYASGNKEKSKLLCLNGSKFSFFLMVTFSMPIIVKAPYILELWLGTFPDYSIIFVRCALLLSMMGILSNALVTEILATGNLTTTTMWIGGTRLITLPLVYLVFTLGFGPESAYFTLMTVELLLLFVRLKILEKITGMGFIKDFINYVLSKIFWVGIIASAIALILNLILPNSFICFIVFMFGSVISTIIIAFVFGMSKAERNGILLFIRGFIKKNERFYQTLNKLFVLWH